ncbi:MAG: carbonic anhydrase [Gemmatimonadetes bacterium]|nr:carbonic anhydrase [Gemmatimonadota bacterium]
MSPTRPRPRTPGAALGFLLEGHRRFASGSPRDRFRTPAHLAALSGEQHPWVAILGCADSRVPPEILFDLGIGDAFTVRVAGNVASAEQIASLEFAVDVLDVPLIVILGHSGCGAVDAALSGAAAPGSLPALLEHVLPGPGARSLDEAVAANVAHQLKYLVEEAPVVRRAIDEGRTGVAGAIEDLSTGTLRLLDGHPPPEPFDG